MNEQEYCLRWHKHLTNFAESFDNLLQNESLVDVTLLADGKQFKAHKIVLSVCSAYFQDAFKDLRDKHPIVILKDVKSHHLRALLDFMYRGEVNVSHEELGPIIKTAQSLSIKGLADGLTDNGDLHSSAPMSLVRPKNSERRSHPTPPPPPPLPLHPSALEQKQPTKPIPDMYNSSPTSLPSVLPSTLAGMPSSLSLASPLSLPHLSFPSSLASTLASSFPSAISQSIPTNFQRRNDMSLSSDGGESPMSKRRRKHRRRSGDAVDSGDSDCRSSGSPGDSAVPNLVLPRIPAKIIPLEELRRHNLPLHRDQSRTHHHSHMSDSQPRDLSIHASHAYSSHLNNYDHLTRKSPLSSVVKTPVSIPSLLPTMDAHCKALQEEKRNQERHPSPPSSQPQDHFHSIFRECDPEDQIKDHSSSPQTDRSSNVSRRSDEKFEIPRPSSKHGSDPESLVSPLKSVHSQNQHDETGSDNHYSEEEPEDENSNEPRERLSDSTPGPSSSRPHSEEGHNSQTYPGWPAASDEHLANFAESSGPGLWNNNFKGGLLTGYLGSSLGRLPASHHASGFTPTFPGLYPGPERPVGWDRSSSSPQRIKISPRIGSNECCRCGRLYKTRKGLKHHIKNECGVEPRFQCCHCDWKFKQKAHLLRHMARKHTAS